MTATARARPAEDETILVFQVAHRLFGIEIGHVQEILHMPELHVPPGMPAFMKGFMRLETRALPVVAAASLLDLPESPIDLYTPIVMLKDPELPLAFVVDQVLEIVSCRPEHYGALQEGAVFNDCAQAVIELPGRAPFHLVRPERLLLAREKQCVAAFQREAQQRLAAAQLPADGENGAPDATRH